MRKLILNNKVVKVYESIDEMPIINFQKYNKYLLIDSGIGSDVDDIDRHITRIAKFVKSGDKAKAIQELQNMRQNMYMINSSISPKNLAFAALIYSVDGQKITDYSDENLRCVLDSLSFVKQSFITKILNKIKKKVESELEAYFPSMFINVKEKDAYDKIKARVLLIADEIINDTDNRVALNEIDTFLYNLYKPKNFNGNDSIEIQYDKQFENSCSIISQKLYTNPKRMTVLEFYNSVEFLKQQSENEQKRIKRIKRT